MNRPGGLLLTAGLICVFDVNVKLCDAAGGGGFGCVCDGFIRVAFNSSIDVIGVSDFGTLFMLLLLFILILVDSKLVDNSKISSF